MKLSFVLLSIFFLFFGNSNFKGGTHAILTGEYVDDIRNANFMVAIHVTQGDETFICGGAIFSETKFVTAAHCLLDMTSATVSLGSLDPDDDDAVTFELKDYEVHPDWNPEVYHSDIAVGYLPRGLPFDDYIDQIEVVEQNYTVNENLRVAAYGYGASNNEDTVNNLRLTVVNVMNFHICSRVYRRANFHGLNENEHFCLGPTDHINHIDVGDSGGPIIDCRTRKLVGIISANIDGKPDFCIKVAGHLQFLADPEEYIRRRLNM